MGQETMTGIPSDDSDASGSFSEVVIVDKDVHPSTAALAILSSIGTVHKNIVDRTSRIDPSTDRYFPAAYRLVEGVEPTGQKSRVGCTVEIILSHGSFV
jgi:hypothetical protein